MRPSNVTLKCDSVVSVNSTYSDKAECNDSVLLDRVVGPSVLLLLIIGRVCKECDNIEVDVGIEAVLCEKTN